VGIGTNSRYKATNDAAALAGTAEAFSRRYQDSVWAKKASVWKKYAARQLTRLRLIL